jgi:aminoglycoside phosphotransferase (APT) family kinase protein
MGNPPEIGTRATKLAQSTALPRYGYAVQDRNWTYSEGIREAVSALLPGYSIDTVERLGSGTDHVAYEVNGELIVRFAKEADLERRAELMRREHELLAAVAQVSPLPVPEPVPTDPELGCLAYLKIQGTPLLHAPGPERLEHAESIATTLGDFLTAIHAISGERIPDLVPSDDQSMREWKLEAAALYATVSERIPLANRGPIEAFLRARPPQERHSMAFSHNDLGIEHVLVDPATWTVTGVIDWSDAAFVDPACDFGLLYRDLGPAALEAALRSYRNEAEQVGALRERAVFYARCSVFEDLAYGVERDLTPYTDKSLAALEWLFKF